MQENSEAAANSSADNQQNTERGTLAAQAYHCLLRAIVTHKLAPGERVSETSLVRRFGLSKSAVRSAMARLSAAGFIVSLSAKTQIVAHLTMGEVRSIFQLRNLLEPNAARAAAGRVDAAGLKRLDAACEAKYTFGNNDEEFAFLEANKSFHLAIAKAAGNAIQFSFIERLHEMAQRILWVSLQIENRHNMWSHGHKDIVAALINGDGDKAASRALAHLQAGQRMVYEVLASSPVFNDILIKADR